MNRKTLWSITLTIFFVGLISFVALAIFIFGVSPKNYERNRQIDECIVQNKLPVNLPDERISCIDGDYPKGDGMVTTKEIASGMWITMADHKIAISKLTAEKKIIINNLKQNVLDWKEWADKYRAQRDALQEKLDAIQAKETK